MALVFVDDDAGFMQWRDSHPSGYIVNTTRKPNPTYLVLHRADCGHITSPNRINWTKQTIKICSSDVNDLIRWAERDVPGYRDLRACRTCDPKWKECGGRAMGDRLKGKLTANCQ